MTDLVTVTITDHVADVRLNRPDKMNALSLPLLETVTATAEQLMRNRDVRAIVLSGEGRAFCAGLDLSNFTNPETFGGDSSQGASCASSRSRRSRNNSRTSACTRSDG